MEFTDPVVEASIYAQVEEFADLPALRQLVALWYATTSDIYSQRLLYAHLKMLHVRDPLEIPKKSTIVPIQICEARAAVAEALIVTARGGSHFAEFPTDGVTTRQPAEGA